MAARWREVAASREKLGAGIGNFGLASWAGFEACGHGLDTVAASAFGAL